MSAAEVTQDSALSRVVAVALRMEEHEQVDRWELADDVKEAVQELTGESENGFRIEEKYHSGLYAALDTVQEEIKKGGAPDVASRDTIRGSYHTAIAWPEEERVDGANYWAHFELRAKEYQGRRQAILRRLVRESSSKRVGTKQVRLWKSNSRTVDLTPRDEKLAKGVRAALRRWASPQKFSQLHEDEQQAAISVLNRLITEITAGEFS